MPVSLPPLSIQYYRYKFPDDSARTVTFYNGLTWNLAHGFLPFGLDIYGQGYSALPIDPAHTKGASVQALLKIGGVWKTHDWTGAPLVTLCRDTLAERVEEMVLIFANWDKTPNRILDPFDRPPTLRATNIGCHEWRGESDISRNEGGVTTRWHLRELKFRRRPPTPFVSAPTTSGPAATGSASAMPTETIAVTSTDPAFAAALPYVLVAGKLDLSVHGTDVDGCTHAYDLTGLLMTPTSPSQPIYLNVMEGVTSGIGYRNIQLSITRMPAFPYGVSVCCPGQACTQRPQTLSTLLFFEPLIHDGLRLQASGIRMEGSARDMPGGGTSGGWYLDAIME
jgi:hypothetical protein